jgi:3-oxoacyl-[acyl-carrier-protein] synthase-3
VLSNDQLALVMDTSDAWVRRRTGVERRHIAADGVGASDLAAQAVGAALADAGVDPTEVDVLFTATMTPDVYAPGIGPLVQDKAGLPKVAAFDLRAQCGGFLYGLDLADAYLRAGRAEIAVVAGAEVHSGYFNWGSGLPFLLGQTEAPPSAEERARATEGRAWSVLFGDGGAAVVLRRDPASSGDVLASRQWSDGSLFDLIVVPGVGFSHRPYVDAAQLEAGLHLPHMNGGELYRQAATLMPQAVRSVCDDAGVKLDELDLVIAHQANERIVEALRGALDLDISVVPSNIAEYGNTTAATLPLLYHEMRRAGRVPAGGLVCFTAFGAGAHWGALLYREG